MIELKKLSKTFRTEDVETAALMDVSLQIEAGEFVSIMGPSGCGKSTLLNILGLLDSPSGGSYLFQETEVAGRSEKQRAELRKQNIGFVFQSFNLIDELNIYDNVELPLRYLKIPVDQRRKRVHKILEQFDLLARMNHYPQQLSGGQQQRAAVARAVVAEPRLILADEPTGNLDSVHGDQVMDSLTRLNAAGTTIVMVTHSESYAEYARRVVHLFDGQIATERVQEAQRAV